MSIRDGMGAHAIPVHLDMSLMEADVETSRAALKTRIATEQAAAFDVNGRYKQLPRTHTDTPVENAKQAPERIVLQSGESWDGITLDDTMPQVTYLTVHDGPDGVGYTVFTEVEIDGRTLVRADGVGTHSETFDFRDITVEDA